MVNDGRKSNGSGEEDQSRRTIELGSTSNTSENAKVKMQRSEDIYFTDILRREWKLATS